MAKRVPQVPFRFERLEPRILLSADPVTTSVALLASDAATDENNETGVLNPPFVKTFPAIGAQTAANDALTLDDVGAYLNGVEHEPRTVVFVDSRVDDYQTLIDGIKADVDVIMLDADKDGIDQISNYLKAHDNVGAMHVVSHGNEQGVWLGQTWLDNDELNGRKGDIDDWSSSFTDDADLLFYGCNLAAGEQGQTLLQRLGELTGADIAASDDFTGHTSLGGDWQFEYHSGQIENAAIFDAQTRAQWSGVLGQITVTTTADQLDGDADTSSLANLALTPGSDGLISLREAIKAANTDLGADVIFLDALTYTLPNVGADDDTGDFDIRDDLSIVGVSPNGTSIDGLGGTSVFDVHDDAAITVAFSNLKIENGSGTGVDEDFGGGLKIEGTANTPNVFLDNVWFEGNYAGGSIGLGGAIYNDGNLTITNSLLEGNIAYVGGAIYNTASGTLSISNVTVSGNNTIGGDGGGLYTAGSATLRNVTVTLNDADDFTAATREGGGIYIAGGTVNMANTIVADNTAEGSEKDISGTVSSDGGNIVKDATGAGGLSGGETGIDPLLNALADNGGDLMTHSLQGGSPAIDGADPSYALSFDQRLFARSDGSPDIGAFEAGASVTPIDMSLYISTDIDVSGGGQPGTDSWQAEDLITIGGSSLHLGPGITDGTFSVAFDLNSFGPGTNTNAAHIVTSNIQIGSSNFQLLAGDLLLSVKTAGTYTSNNTTPRDSGFAASVSVDRQDLVVFRPDTAGDYSTGAFAMLLQDVTASGELRGIALIEQTMVVGGTTLEAGDFLYSRNGPGEDHSIWLYETGTVGFGAVADNRTEFLDGDAGDVGIQEKIRGLHLVQQTAKVGGHTLGAGTILVHVDTGEDVGSNNLTVDEFDIFALDVSESSLAGSGSATATKIFDGSHVAFDTAAEDLDTITLAPSAGLITAHYLDRFDTDGSFAGNDGSLSWANDWQEVGETNGAASGDVRVFDNFSGDGGGNVELRISDNLIAWREADLLGHESATLSFDYARSSVELGDDLVVYVQMGGGSGANSFAGAPGTWQEIARYPGAADDSAYLADSIDISAYIADDTRILFRADGATDGNDFFYIDNVRIDLSGSAVVTNPLADSSAGAPYTIDEGDPITFDGSASSDPNGSITDWEWDIGNNGSFEKSGVNVTYSWAELMTAGVNDDGTFDVALRVTDNDAETDTTTFTLTVNDLPATFSAFSGVLDSTAEETEVEISFADLLAQADENEPYGSVDAFVVRAISSGTLKIGTDAASATAWAGGTNDTIDATLNAYWTPAVDDTGVLNAFTVEAQDDDGNLSGAPVSAQVTVSNNNDAPTLAGGPYDFGTTDEDTVSTGVQVSTMLAGLTTNDADGDTLGIAITLAGGSNVWQYSTDSTDGIDGTWTDFGAVSDTAALLLSDSAWVRYSPDTVNGENVSLEFHAWDQTTGSEGSTINISGTETIRDEFSSGAYNNNDGTQNWNGDWTETNDDGVVSTGNILVAGGVLSLDSHDGPDDEAITRAVDLTGVGSAFLNFDFSVLGALEVSDWAKIEARGNGIGWTTINELTFFTGPASGSRSLDISAFAAADTEIRFQIESQFAEPDEYLTIDNVEIVYTTTAATGGSTAFSMNSAEANLAVTDVNDVPTLTNFAAVIDSTAEETEVEITFAELAAQGNENDIDGSVDAFVVQGVTTGTLMIGTSSGTATAWAAGTNDTINGTLNAYWTPATDDTGTLNAFTVVAEDNDGDESTPAVTAQVTVTNVNDAPTIVGGPYNLGSTDEDTISTGVQVSTILGGFTTGDAEGDTLGLAITSATGNNVWQFSTDSTNGSDGTWTDFSTVNATSALLLSNTSWVRYSPDTINPENVSLTFRTWDGTTGTASTTGTAQNANPGAGGGASAYSNTNGVANLTVTDVNDVPTLTTMTAVVDSTAEETEVEITFAELAAQGNENDIDGSVDAFVVQGVTTGTLKIGASAGAATAWAAGTNDTINGSLNAYWTPDTNDTGTLNAFTVVAEDNDGDESTPAVSAQVTVTPVNDAPTISGGPYNLGSTDEDTISTGVQVSTILGGFTTGDAEGDTLGVAITSATGNNVWQYSTDSTNGSDGTWTDFSAVNATSALLLSNTSWVRYSPDTINPENVSLTFRAWDGTMGAASTTGTPQNANPGVGGGASAYSNTNGVANLTVNDVNDAPTLTNFAAVIDSTAEETEVEITFAELAAQGNENDIDGSVDAFVVQGVTTGTLKIGTSAGAATAWAAGTNDTINGTLNAYWTPDTDDTGTLNAFTVVAEDNDGDESTPAVSAQVTVTPVNDAPTISGGPYNLGSTDEDTISTGVQVSTILGGFTTGDAEGDTLGVAITSATGNNVWQFSTDSTNGSDGTWTDFSTVNATSALLLSNTSWVRYSPDTINPENVSLSFRAWDGTTGTASTTGTAQNANPGAGGGASAYSNTNGVANLTVTDVNDVPTLTTMTAVVDSTAEETEVEITFAELAAQGNENDIDGSVDAFVVQGVTTGTLMIGTSSGTATAWAAGTNDTINGSLNAYWTPTNEASGTLNAFTVVAEDNDGDESTAAITAQISVTAVNDQLGATNVDQTHAYTEGAASVALNNIVVTDDDIGEMVTATLTLTDTATGSLSVSGGATYTPGTGVWTITDNVANVNAALANVAFIPEVNNDVNTTVTVNIADGGEDATTVVTGTINLNVSAVNDQPNLLGTPTNPTATEVGAGTAPVALLQGGSVSVIDPDAPTFNGGAITVSLDGYRAGDVLSVVGAPVGISTVTGGNAGDLTITLNAFATPANVATILEAIRFTHNGDDPIAKGVDPTRVYDITLNDGGNSPGPALDSNTLSGTITLVDENDPPTFTTLSGSLVGANELVEEEIHFSDIVPLSDATDVDGSVDAYVVKAVVSGTLRIGTSAGTATAFLAGVNDTIDATNHAYWTSAPAASGVIDAFDLVAQDNDGLESAILVRAQVNVFATNQTPTVDQNTLTINEGQAKVLNAGDLAASDVDDFDPGLTINVSGVANGQFERASNPGIEINSFAQSELTAGNIRFVHDGGEQAPSYSITVNDGSLTSAVSPATIFFTNLNDAPSIGLNKLTIDQGGNVTLTVGADLASTDPDDDAKSLNYSVVSVDGGRFERADGSGVTTFTQADVNAGLIRFVHDGSDDAPSYTLTVSDGSATSKASIAEITFTLKGGNEFFETEEQAAESAVIEDALESIPNPLDEPAPDVKTDEPAPDDEELVEAPTPDEQTTYAYDDFSGQTGPAIVATTTDNDEVFTIVDDRQDNDRDSGRQNFLDNVRALLTDPLKNDQAIIDPLINQVETALELMVGVVQQSTFKNSLDSLRDDVADDVFIERAKVGSTVAVSTGLSVGYVVWLIRGGVLLSSMLSALPAWRFIDPLPVLAFLGADDDEEDEDSLESLVSKGTAHEDAANPNADAKSATVSKDGNQ